MRTLVKNGSNKILHAQQKLYCDSFSIQWTTKYEVHCFINVCILYVFSVNIGCGPAEERVLLTGLHAVADIFCECCKTTLGWKYVSIEQMSQPDLLPSYIITMESLTFTDIKCCGIRYSSRCLTLKFVDIWNWGLGCQTKWLIISAQQAEIICQHSLQGPLHK